MKIINLNESQYKRLFENYKDFGDEAGQSSVPTTIGGSEAATMIVGGTEGSDGETEFVDKNKSRRKNYLNGAGMKQKTMAIQYPWSGGRGVPY